MMVRTVLIGLLILVTWSGMDYALHIWVLAPFYNANPGLWRPMAEMDAGLILSVRVALIAAFMATYHWWVNPKSVRSGVLFGLMIGLQLGIGVGVGTYIHIPVPPALAIGWLLGAVVKSVAAGWMVGAWLPPASSLPARQP